MTLEEFKKTLSDESPPEGLDKAVQALWHDANGDWDTAHNLAQSVGDTTGAWVHAYLHRKEGDLSNASYWYSRASRSMPKTTLEEEWEQIVSELL
ncbi:hypothetical protein GWO43_16405 [candidate division KSB1 bacterium]|nr:hypothetical protein [candidate division KSB1 bacterium]NIR68715.1 hypothetical protein [candidate division KSB1 bacterium]NIS25532.1 hypothetical protein [candidate division KSB1 bacterium]NIT72425.1 hypothetical protein [candidate division KSB1 bacterium]NIU26209.1 hypothetical protein [candidate division KSB1 bacterium]